jgi:hypothetical protein
MLSVAGLAIGSLKTVIENKGLSQSFDLHESSNLLEMLDSFTIVDLLLETESRFELALGRYVPLANEDLFDMEKSPLRSWSAWIVYLERSVNG